MTLEEAVRDVKLFYDEDYEEMKNNGTDIMDKIGETLEADSVLREELEAASLRANEFIGLKRQISKAKYEERNAEFISTAGFKEDGLVFVSSFSPMIIASLTADEIYTLAETDEVIYLDEFVNLEAIETQSISLSVTDGYYNKTVYGYTGTGVNVGQIEPTNPYTICTANVTVLGTANRDAHATRVAEIIGGDYSYAPNCQIYSIAAALLDDFYEAFETLLSLSGSQTINVINLSMGYLSQGTGIYDF